MSSFVSRSDRFEEEPIAGISGGRKHLIFSKLHSKKTIETVWDADDESWNWSRGVESCCLNKIKSFFAIELLEQTEAKV